MRISDWSSDVCSSDLISDAARWTISQGYADANRLCIYGASYGGYAALMSAVREPELYRCAVGLAGVYDLQRWKRETDVSDSRLGRRYIAEEIGSTDEEQIGSASGRERGCQYG